jgi:hypothetical protein
MATKRRIEAAPEAILRDLVAVLVRMQHADTAVALGCRLSNKLARQYVHRAIGVKALPPDLAPVGAVVASTRGAARRVAPLGHPGGVPGQRGTRDAGIVRAAVWRASAPAWRRCC